MKDGYPTIDNAFNTAHDYGVICKFASGIEMNVTSREDNGILFEGTKGRIFVSRGRITGLPIEQNWDQGKFEDSDLRRLYKDKPAEGHKANFYRCIREGRATDFRCLFACASDEHLPLGGNRGAAGPENPVGSENRKRSPEMTRPLRCLHENNARVTRSRAFS